MINLVKLGLYFSLIGEYRLDPMVFELIAHERRLEAEKAAAAEAAQHADADTQDEEHIREAA